MNRNRSGVGDESLAWIEVHQHLKEHRKTRKFKNLMGITRAQAMGHLVMLWLWGIDNTDDCGIIQDADNDDIAMACDYHGDSQTIVNSLIEAGFLEKDEKGEKLFIHDFEDYIGKLRTYKRRHREAQKRYSDKSKGNPNDGHTDNQGDGHNDCPNDGLKIANLTVPSPSPSPSPSPITPLSSNKFADDAIELILASELYDLILLNNPNSKKPNLQSWSKQIDLMIRVDKRSASEIREVIRWSQRDSFWQTNILSTKKLREKYDQLTMKMKSGTETNRPKVPRKPVQQDITAQWLSMREAAGANESN